MVAVVQSSSELVHSRLITPKVLRLLAIIPSRRMSACQRSRIGQFCLSHSEIFGGQKSSACFSESLRQFPACVCAKFHHFLLVRSVASFRSEISNQVEAWVYDRNQEFSVLIQPKESKAADSRKKHETTMPEHFEG